MGYEMPQAAAESAAGSPASANAPQPEPAQLRVSASARARIITTPARWGTNWGTGFQFTVTDELMQRGQQRFNINCAVCHGLTAAGNGITKQYGLATVVTLQDERIRKMADGEIFNTITNGKNTMLAYGPNVTVADRWAIIAYLRALQRSQNADSSGCAAGSTGETREG